MDALDDLDTDSAANPLFRRSDLGEEDTALGARLRATRKAQGLKLKEVADQAGLSLSLLSQIERGLSSPSIRALRQLCHALGIDGATLFAGPDAQPLPTASGHASVTPPVVRAATVKTSTADRPSARASDYVVRMADRMPISVVGVTKYRVTPRGCAAMEGFVLEISAGAASDPDFSWQTGDKIAYVLAGELTLYINDIVLELNAGDVYGFSSGHRYRWENNSTTPTTLLVVNGDHFYV
jgi:quercetin dioxygenase-like cupin family protein/DNA-binding XRE family transcriptional regulator